MFAGSGTSTPTLQAALAAAGNQDPAIGYSVSYPFGVVGPIVLMTIMAALVKPKFEPPSQNVRVAELTLESNCEDRTVEELSATLPADVKIVAVRQHHVNAPPVARNEIAGRRRIASGRQPGEHRASQGRPWDRRSRVA